MFKIKKKTKLEIALHYYINKAEADRVLQTYKFPFPIKK